MVYTTGISGNLRYLVCFESVDFLVKVLMLYIPRVFRGILGSAFVMKVSTLWSDYRCCIPRVSQGILGSGFVLKVLTYGQSIDALYPEQLRKILGSGFALKVLTFW